MRFIETCVACLWAMVTYDTIKSIVKEIGVFLTNKKKQKQENKLEGE